MKATAEPKLVRHMYKINRMIIVYIVVYDESTIRDQLK